MSNRTTHGLSKTKEYKSWCNMKERCNNPNRHDYKRYGGRGINYCKRWEIFENFIKDMGKCPENYSLDRIDNNGNYTSSNCKWSSHIEQANNTRRNKIINYKEFNCSLIELCEKLNIDYELIRGRIRKGWSFEKSIQTPKRNWKRRR